jgi:CubicO group peptidase (beta-lactamase class C family)
MAVDARSLTDRLVALITEHGVPGAAVSVVCDGEQTDAVAGVVNLRTGVPVGVDSPFMVQSVTKVLTATLVMQLVDEGLVRLDDPVRRHLPTFRTADEAASARITVRHLLTHTGGFEGDLWQDTTAGPDALQRLVEDHVSVAPQHLPPGELFSYCSGGMAVLGRLVEVLRGTTYAAALRRHLAGPLGLDGVVADAGEALGFRTAIGHVAPRAGAAERPLRTWAVMPPSNPAAGNQLAMPAAALARFGALHAADGTRLLSAESAQRMREPLVPVPTSAGMTQGLGWQVRADGRVVEHSGGAPGNAAWLYVVPDRRLSVALLANGGAMLTLLTTLGAELLAELADVAPVERPPTPEPAPVRDAERYVGTYAVRTERAEVRVDTEGRLRLTRTPQHEAVEQLRLAGAEVATSSVELRRLEGETFVGVDAGGRRAGTVAFVGGDAHGATFLHAGRAMPRVSARSA